MNTEAAPQDLPNNGSELMELFLPNSPFVVEMGITLLEISDGRAKLSMPFRPELVTVGDMVHGGAIAALIDIAAMVTSWAGAPVPEKLRGVTVSLATEFVEAANSEDLTAEGTLLRRGASLTMSEVEVRSAADERLIAKALATYKVG